MKLSVIIPFFNQSETIIKILKNLDSIPEKFQKEIILVDDGSTDDCKKFLNDYIREKISVLAIHKIRGGREAVLRTGLSQATGEIILLLDFGMIYHAEDYSKLIKPIIELNADLVWVPYSYKTNSLPISSFWIFLWNRFLTLVTNFFCNLNITHFRAGGILFNRKFFKRISFCKDRGLLEPQLLARIAESKSRIFEVIPMKNKIAKPLSLKSNIDAFYSIIKYNLFF